MMPSRPFLASKPQVIALGKTAELSKKSPAELMGILDPAIALAFDLEVAMALDDERAEERMNAERRQLEILAAATNVALTQDAQQALG